MKKLFSNKNEGMTLIEIVLSMAIFGLLAVIFITIFTTSTVWIYKAGDKAEAYSDAQSELESNMARNESYENPDLVVTFGSDNYNIQGGKVESNQNVGKSSSNIETFIPLVPTISLNPKVKSEGYSNNQILITGYNTHFQSSNTLVEIFDKEGNTKIGSTLVPTINSEIEAIINIPNNLLNNDYIIRTKTTIADEPDEYSRGKLIIETPKYITSGDNNIYISPDGINWTDRSTLPYLPSFSNLNAISNNGQNYVIVGDNGLVLASRYKPNNNQYWDKTNIFSAGNLNDITWSAHYNKFFSVGEEGGLFSSTDGISWSKIGTFTYTDPDDSSNELPYSIKSITSSTLNDGSDLIVATGSNGLILFSNDGNNFSLHDLGIDNNFYSIAYGSGGTFEYFIIVGENGLFSRSENGVNWSVPTSINSSNLNNIFHNKANGEFIAVGNTGLVMKTSDGGTNWSSQTLGTKNLADIYIEQNNYFIVGDDRIMYNSSDGTTWTQTYSENSGDNLTSIFGR